MSITNKGAGNPFDENLVQKVWQKGETIEDNLPQVWRKDICGQFIRRDLYGNKESRYGWVIDHIKPHALNGDDSLDNLQPMQWENNIRKGDKYPWNCER